MGGTYFLAMLKSSTRTLFGDPEAAQGQRSPPGITGRTTI